MFCAINIKPSKAALISYVLCVPVTAETAKPCQTIIQSTEGKKRERNGNEGNRNKGEKFCSQTEARNSKIIRVCFFTRLQRLELSSPSPSSYLITVFMALVRNSAAEIIQGAKNNSFLPIFQKLSAQPLCSISDTKMEQSTIAHLFMLGSYMPSLFSICMKILG